MTASALVLSVGCGSQITHHATRPSSVTMTETGAITLGGGNEQASRLELDPEKNRVYTSLFCVGGCGTGDSVVALTQELRRIWSVSLQLHCDEFAPPLAVDTSTARVFVGSCTQPTITAISSDGVARTIRRHAATTALSTNNNGILFAAADVLSALDERTGKELWVYRSMTGPAAETGGKLYLPEREGLVELDDRTGRRLRTLPLAVGVDCSQVSGGIFYYREDGGTSVERLRLVDGRAMVPLTVGAGPCAFHVDQASGVLFALEQTVSGTETRYTVVAQRMKDAVRLGEFTLGVSLPGWLAWSDGSTSLFMLDGEHVRRIGITVR